MPHFDMYNFSVMMPASLLRKRTKTSPKYEQTEATYFFIITKIIGVF